MIWLEATALLLIFLALNVVTYAFITLDSKILAKSEQRVGMFFQKRIFTSQIAMDYLKMFGKRSGLKAENRGVGFLLVLLGVLSFPYWFAHLLFYPTQAQQESYGGVLFLYLILFISVISIDLLHYLYGDKETKIQITRQALHSVLGVTLNLFSLFPPFLHMSGGALAEIEKVQDSFPFFYMLTSPFAFLAALCWFASIFYIVPTSPISARRLASFPGIWQGLLNFSRETWLVCLISFWVVLFVGGGMSQGNIFEVLFFVIKFFVVATIFIWIRRFLPRMRTKDSIEMGVKILLPASCAAVVGEVCWLVLL